MLNGREYVVSRPAEAERTRRSPATDRRLCAAAGRRYVAAERECEPLWRIRLDTALRRRDVDWLGPHERSAHLHRRRWRHRRPDRREQREHESFLCTTREFDDFELELETMVDRVTNQGIIRSGRVQSNRPVEASSRSPAESTDLKSKCAVSIRGSRRQDCCTARRLGQTGCRRQRRSRPVIIIFVDQGWNKLRIVAHGPRIQTWVNGQAVEDLVNEDVYKTHPSGFIGLQIHGLSEREINQPLYAGSGVTVGEPLISRWRNIRIRPLGSRR